MKEVLYDLGVALFVVVCIGMGAIAGVMIRLDRGHVNEGFVIGGVVGLILAVLVILAMRWALSQKKAGE